MKALKIFLLGATTFLIGCQPPNPSAADIVFKSHDKNSCLVDSAIFKAVYKQYNGLKPYYWTRILVIIFKDNGAHATCVYTLPNDSGQNFLFSYDYGTGSRLIDVKDIEPLLIAKYLYEPKREVVRAYFLENFR